MGSGGTKTQQISKRGPEPQELTNLRNTLYNKILPGLESYSADDWNNARNIANNAINQQSQLLSQLPGQITSGNNIANEIANIARTGNIPSGVQDRLNASVNSNLQSSLGSTLSSLGNRGVLNSSITSQGINNLSQAAADAYNRNYLTAYNSAIGGLGSALQGQQSSTSALLSGINALGNIPSQAYENAGAALTPAFNLWNRWQSSYDNREDFDTIVTPRSSGCITGETTVRLSDGQEIPVSELDEGDEIQAWDFEEGCLVSVPLTAFFKRAKNDGVEVIRVDFEDGSSVGVIYEHLFFDMTDGKFIAVNSNSQDFIGHDFAKVTPEGEIVPVKVKNIYASGKAEKMYAPQSCGHLNFLAEGFITGNDGQLGLCNRYKYDIEKMRYDKAAKKSDLEKYGLLEYDELKGILSHEFFDANHCEEFSVSIGKGLLTLEELRSYLATYAPCFLE